MLKSPLIRHASMLTLFGVLAACGTIDKLNERGKIDYKNTTQSKPLDIPPDLTAVTADERFIVPDIGAKGVATASGLAGESGAPVQVSGTPVLQKALDVKLEKSGNQRWLVVNRPPEAVWPVVREFWLQSGFNLKIEKPEIGILETDWTENRAKIPMDGVRRIVGKVFDGLYSSDELDRYRTRLERSESGTEIYISHRGLLEAYADNQKIQTVWQPRPADPELEAEFLNRLVVKLAGEAPKVAAVEGKAPLVAAKAVINSDGTQKRLIVSENFDRAWRRVGLALDRTGFTVEDRDRSKGMYFVQYNSPEGQEVKQEGDGFFSKLFGGGKKTVDVDLNPQSRYRIKVATSNNKSEVTVLNTEGVAVKTSAADKILALLENELR
ncbi:MAG: outer membrane protein assembly factor BamC [Burkholderiales bacterium]|jgi:outer membrane protein assembly factor BamC|nr:outer membrane protein assembly factor BamC [Burkholderiales bacterium]